MLNPIAYKLNPIGMRSLMYMRIAYRTHSISKENTFVEREHIRTACAHVYMRLANSAPSIVLSVKKCVIAEYYYFIDKPFLF